MSEEEEAEMEEMFEQDDENIKKTMRIAKRLVDGIQVVPHLIKNEMCDRCHKQKDKLIKMDALVGYKSKNGVVIDCWWNQFCLECLSKVAETKIEIEDKEIAGYT